MFVQGDLIMDEGSLVNNVDVSELKDKVVTLDGYQTITGLTVSNALALLNLAHELL